MSTETMPALTVVDQTERRLDLHARFLRAGLANLLS